MTLSALFVLAVALAMDAFAVCLTTGIHLRCVRFGQTMRMAGAFGFFQFIMPIIGWLLGVRAHKYIENYDHWLAFALLAFVGLKMLKESWDNRGKGQQEYCCQKDPMRGTNLLLLGIATSLDALAVGLSLALLGAEVWLPALLIGVVCFTISVIGIHLGRFVCRLPGLANIGNHANALGGIVLLAIGVKILHEHGALG